MKVLFAGGTGRLGAATLPRLIDRGIGVRVLTRDASRVSSSLGDSVEIAVGDVRDRRLLADAVRGVDAIISAVTGLGFGQAGPAAIDHKGNVNLIAEAEAAKVGRYVLVSVYAAAPAHPMTLMRMKYRAEEALRSSSLDWRIVRPTAFLELWTEIIGDPIKRTGRTTVFGRGDNPINFVSVDTVAAQVVEALGDSTSRGSVVDASGPRDLTFNQLASEIAKRAGRDVKIRHVPRPMLRASRAILLPIRPDVAGMIEAGIVMDTADMRAPAMPPAATSAAGG